MAKAKYIGNTKIFECWKDEYNFNHLKVEHGMIFNIRYWGKFNAVLTDKNEWLCDLDSTCFVENFELIESEEN